MRKNLYIVYDKISRSTIGPAFAEAHDAPAVRAFSDAILSSTHDLGKHPDDYDVRHIAEIDDSTGAIISAIDGGFRIVITGTEVIEDRRLIANKEN